MREKVDYLFLFTLKNYQTGIAFCSAKVLRVDQARDEILKVFTKIKRTQVEDLNYVGSLNYTDMQQGVIHQLSNFEKYNPVWIGFLHKYE